MGSETSNMSMDVTKSGPMGKKVCRSGLFISGEIRADQDEWEKNEHEKTERREDKKG